MTVAWLFCFAHPRLLRVALELRCVQINLPLHPNSISKSMFHNNYFISALTFLISLLLLFNRKEDTIEMPPKPKLNVQKFPRPPLLERTPRHLQIKWHGQTIADTNEAYWVLETYHAPSNLS